MFFETLESRELLTIVPVEGTPFGDYSGNFLPPKAYHAASSSGYLSGPTAGQPLDIALNYLQQNAAAYGLSPSDLANYQVTDQYTSPDLGVTHIYLGQTFNGLPVADANININVMSDGKILTAGSSFLPGLGQLQESIDPDLSIQEAVYRIANELGTIPSGIQIVQGPSGLSQRTIVSSPNVSVDPIELELHYVAMPGGGVDLAWEIIARPPNEPHWFDVSIAASGANQGQVLRVADWVADASYNVFPRPTQDPVFGGRAIVTNPWSPTASPFGWHDSDGTLAPNFTDTRGNNVFAQEDRSGGVFLGFPGGFRPQGGPSLNFNFPLDFQQNPQSYESASITNLFYWVNIAHDVSFDHGFTEAAGNFQVNNYTGTGLENDPVMANNQELYDLGLRNNAFMGTPPDGQRPTMGMFLFDRSITTGQLLNPLRDGSLDGGIIAHEFTHGISNRLTGGPANANALQALQSGGMGEGWGDWFGLVLTARPGQNKNTPRGTGEWVSGESNTGGGIRRFPYSFDMSVDPRQLNFFNGDNFPQQNNSEVHNAGEIWASALWDMTQLLIDKLGFSTNLFNHVGGQNVAMDLVFAGMKLQPANPSFMEARDAILAADQALFGGQNFAEIWTAFSRRGFGFSASSGLDSNSVEVSATFDLPPIPIGGVVIEDTDGDGILDANEGPLAGWTLYNDANNNKVRDAGEPSATSAADGSYSIPVPSGQTARIREVLQPNYKLTAPTGGVYTVNVAIGQNLTNLNFFNQPLPSHIEGFKFNDLDGSGSRDADEPGIAGVMIYVDLNQDGRVGVLEPAAVTDANGFYRITVTPGTGYQVREVTKPGLVQTFPDPADVATLGGAHVNVTVLSTVATTGINFGNTESLDFGDAPVSYGTLLAGNGPRHGIVPGYGLTLTPASGLLVVDAEGDGQPLPDAIGDDAGSDDENGVLFLSGLTPGNQATVRVGVRTSGFSSGVLQGWIDFNRDGDFLDAGEQIVKDKALGTGIHDLVFTVPAGASLGTTYSRFRYGIERGIGPLGAAVAGEVEDHVTNILQDMPIATNDVFPDLSRVPPDPFIQLNSVDNPLDVLRNDFGTTTDPTPEIVAADFSGPGQTKTTAQGGTVKFQGPNLPLLYTPQPGYTGPDSFTYRVTTTGAPSPSAPATVSITISPSDPIAIDDIFRLNPAPTNVALNVLANDLAAINQTKLIKAGSVIPVGPTSGTTLVPNAARDRLLFTAPPSFRGTVRYQYTIDDNDPTTTDGSAIVTIQVTDGPTTPAPSHAATYRTQYLAADQFGNPTGSPTSVINLANSEFFFVQLVVLDPPGTPTGLPNTTGVESAYVDMLVSGMGNNPALPVAEPVRIANGTRFDIIFNSKWPDTLNRRDQADFSQPGVLNEIGATHDPRLETPNGGSGNSDVIVMTVKFRALQGGTVTVQADHADSPQLPNLLFDPTDPIFPTPIEITDEQVFIQPAAPLTILGGSGEGEFTNFRNFYDVNDDTLVNPLDILMVVNDLTQNGSRPLDQLAIALAGALPAGYLDTNLDSLVNPLDLLGIVNFLTAKTAVNVPQGGSGEGEGEAEGETAAALTAAAAPTLAAGGGTADDSLADEALLILATQPTSESVAVSQSTSSADESAMPTSSSTAVIQSPTSSEDDDEPAAESGSSQTSSIDAEAADELFATLSSLRQRLRARL